MLSKVDTTLFASSADMITISTGENDFDVYSALKPPISLHSVFYENGKFRRMPEEIAKQVSSGVHVLHSIPAGGRVKFRTDSKTVSLFAEIEPYQVPQMSILGSSGFEIFADGKFEKAIYLPIDTKKFEPVENLNALVTFTDKKFREITIYLPLYCRVRNIHIGVDKGANVLEQEEYKKAPPIVYYGSSITQGCCASKPSCIYQSFIERWSKFDYKNFGFAGNCKGEQNMAEYLASQDMCAFVLDYDYNAPNPEHLKATHLNVYKTIRQKHKDIPIIMLSKPLFRADATSKKCLRIIKETYRYALANGDTNVRLIDGHKIFPTANADVMTAEGCHPTDLGFYFMAKKLYATMKTFDLFK